MARTGLIRGSVLVNFLPRPGDERLEDGALDLDLDLVLDLDLE